ncbi:response regulator transcription factor [Agrobacterium sp. BA1120]|uniref:response regulator transcription factor n=1 Tax=Agrobacterium sp. BA1120 TaxID=3228927 RepID=UPI00336A80EB
MSEMVKLERPRLILVEDDHDLRNGLAEYLELRGFVVAQAANGVEFHSLLVEEVYDLAILDVNLPDISGFDLARFLAQRHDMGIIILTALRARDDRLRGYNDGADLYFTKPVDSEELAQAAENLTRRVRRERLGRDVPKEAPHAQEVSVRGKWILDRKRQMLIAPNGKGIQLSVRETMLLEFFANHPAPMITRMDVLQFYDPTSSDPFSRRFDVAFGRLRVKAKEADVELPVQVIRGAGVRLVETIEVI